MNSSYSSVNGASSRCSSSLRTTGHFELVVLGQAAQVDHALGFQLQRDIDLVRGDRLVVDRLVEPGIGVVVRADGF